MPRTGIAGWDDREPSHLWASDGGAAPWSGTAPWDAGTWTEVARADGVLGELVLRERGTDRGALTELVCNGVQVMDDADAQSEVALATEALDALGALVRSDTAADGTPGPSGSPGPRGSTDTPEPTATPGSAPTPPPIPTAKSLHVVVGGLGMAFTVRALLDDDRLGPSARVSVVEIEPAVVAWNRGGLVPATAGTLDDPRVQVVVGDVAAVLAGMAGEGVDAVLLDVDNGPGFLVADSNAGLYAPEGLAVAAAPLRRGGVLAVWSAQAAPGLTRALEEAVGPAVVRHTPVVRGGRDLSYWVHLAHRR